jgi:aminopeptidase N
MEILKESILWQAARSATSTRSTTYRTICMEKSNFGGMENVGNTTIITEAALIDEWTTTDAHRSTPRRDRFTSSSTTTAAAT